MKAWQSFQKKKQKGCNSQTQWGHYKERTFSGHSRKNARVNSHHLQQYAQDLCKPKWDKISSWRGVWVQIFPLAEAQLAMLDTRNRKDNFFLRLSFWYINPDPMEYHTSNIWVAQIGLDAFDFCFVFFLRAYSWMDLGRVEEDMNMNKIHCMKLTKN